MIRAPSFISHLGFVFLLMVGSSSAQDEPPTVISITLRPAKAPLPALKYGIIPEQSNLIQGNAALFYHRAIEMILEARRFANPAKGKVTGAPTDELSASAWLSGPLASVPLDRAHQWLDQHRYALHEVELGARRRSCDWEFVTRGEGFQLQISEIQNMRSLARLVALRVRVATIEHKHDEALYWLQTGFAMARHVSQGPILVQSLVGIATCSIMNRAVEDLIQSPGMPSLYWALVNRPHPFIDLGPALEGERILLEREVPQLRELDGLPWSVEKARAFSDELRLKFLQMSSEVLPVPFGQSEASSKDWFGKLNMAALIAQSYPDAKRSLIAQGRSAAQIESMPTVQVAALYAFQTYQEHRDDLFKWLGLPYQDAYKGMNAVWQSRHDEFQRRPLLRLFTMLLPAVESSYLSSMRLERDFNALQCIEAVRVYSATHGGLPDRLAEVSEAPVPIDPLTGLSFGYERDGDLAKLTAPYAPGAPRIPAFAIHYELRLAR